MSIADTIRNTLVPVHRDGWPFVAAFAGATLLLGVLWGPLFWIGLALTAWCAYFFRDPERVTPVDDRLVISPADGRVSAVGPAIPPRELAMGQEEMTRVSVGQTAIAGETVIAEFGSSMPPPLVRVS